MAFWIKLTYERDVYVVDLDRVAAFRQISKGRIAFTLPDSNIPIVIHQQADCEAYQKILEYVEKTTGYQLGE